MSIYSLVRLLHISSAMVFVGGLFARQVVRAQIRPSTDLRGIDTLTRAAGGVERLLVIPGNILAIVFGVTLALLTRMPIFGAIQGASQNWLLAATLVIFVLFLQVPIVFLPRGKRFEAALQDALGKGEITPELRAHLNDPVVRRAHAAEFVGVAVVVALMVLKPF